MSQQEGDEPGAFTVNLGGDGDGGGSSSGGSSAPADPLGPYRSLFLRLRIPPGPFIGLMHQAAAQKWSADELMWALEGNPRFNKMFPGIQQLLDEGMSVSSAVAAWRRLGQEYSEAAKEGGWGKIARLNPERIGYLIENNIDLDEFKMRASILEYARHTEGARQAFNAILKKRGDRQLDRQGWFKFIMGKGEQALYDTYEGAVLFQELGPEGLSKRQARRLGRVVSGTEGAPAFDASSIAAAFQEIRNKLGSQILDESGIRAKEMALAVLGSQEGIHFTRPKAARRALAAREHLEQIARNVQGVETGTENTATMQTQSGRPISSAATLP
jgi:hypothetical protein